jgi:hypothetical protein
MKQIFAYLLLTIIAFQVLPLKEVSALIYGKQMVEEICYASTDADGKSTDGSEDLKKSDLFYHTIHLNFSFCTIALGINPLGALEYASRLADDIPTPPPLHWS